MSLDEKEKQNKLKKHQPGKKDISRILAAIQRRLADAGTVSLHNETRLEQTYEAVLLCSRAALEAVGYRVRQAEGYHYESIDSLQYTLGTEGNLLKYFQVLRRKRHKGLYEGFISVPDSEVDEAIKSAQALFDNLRKWLAANHPDLYEGIQG